MQPNYNITAIHCGTSSPQLGGTIDISAFANLTDFTCSENNVTAISGYENNINLRRFIVPGNQITSISKDMSLLTNIEVQRNNITGSLPLLGANARIVYFNNNFFSGNIPSLSSCVNLESAYFRTQLGTTRLTGPIPDLSNNTKLQNLLLESNQLTGTIPSLSANTLLRDFRCNANRLTGTIPSLNGLAFLRLFRCNNQQGTIKLTGSIPSLSTNIELQEFRCDGNQITHFDGDSVADTLGNFQAQANQLTSTAVNAILAAFVAANRTEGTRILNLGGVGNAAPTGQGITDRQTLLNRGWRTATGSTAITN